MFLPILGEMLSQVPHKSGEYFFDINVIRNLANKHSLLTSSHSLPLTTSTPAPILGIYCTRIVRSPVLIGGFL
jgi:hypothetical protein